MADTVALNMKVEMDETEYRIVGPGGEEGRETEYGEVAVLRVGLAVYYAIVDDPNTTAPEVMRVDSVTAMPTEQEDVIFGDDEGMDLVEGGGIEEEPEGDPEEEEEEDEEDDEEADEDEEDDEEEDDGAPGE